MDVVASPITSTPSAYFAPKTLRLATRLSADHAAIIFNSIQLAARLVNRAVRSVSVPEIVLMHRNFWSQ